MIQIKMTSNITIIFNLKLFSDAAVSLSALTFIKTLQMTKVLVEKLVGKLIQLLQYRECYNLNKYINTLYIIINTEIAFLDHHKFFCNCM